ncbi:response regulator [Vibrio tapetis subsp. quintayensis]|uniref:response regulator n=1 Tax=Vibrio tapetis TaxID=52443 RepID=UPI0025B5F3B9|nr:response regulator [Vibrio tapetis]MDN3682877.1 response regulator [Vibrio tapetis subsp. quintayensis]
MESQYKLLLVSSELRLCQELTAKLEKKYHLKVVSEVIDAQNHIETDKPDVIILDSHLNNESITTFQENLVELKQRAGFAIISIVEKDEMEQRLTAYAAGATDIIRRDFNEQELLAKLNVIEQYLRDKSDLLIECEEAKSASFEFMKEASQYGLVLQFFRNLACCNYIEQLSFTLFQTLESFDLHASLLIRDDENHYFDNQTGIVKPIERNIFDLLRNEGRIYEFGNRMILNDIHTAFLVKNLPDDDERMVGQLRDVLALMIEGLEAKFLDIQRQSMLQDMVEEIADSISGVSHNVERFDAISANNYNNAIAALNSAFHYLGLTEDQEEQLSTLYEKGFKEMQFAKKELTEVQATLSALLEKVNSTDITHKPDKKPPEDLGGEVELF